MTDILLIVPALVFANAEAHIPLPIKSILKISWRPVVPFSIFFPPLFFFYFCNTISFSIRCASLAVFSFLTEWCFVCVSNHIAALLLIVFSNALFVMPIIIRFPALCAWDFEPFCSFIVIWWLRKILVPPSLGYFVAYFDFGNPFSKCSCSSCLPPATGGMNYCVFRFLLVTLGDRPLSGFCGSYRRIFGEAFCFVCNALTCPGKYILQIFGAFKSDMVRFTNVWGCDIYWWRQGCIEERSCQAQVHMVSNRLKIFPCLSFRC